jgi:hypothetical protein
VLTRKPSKLIFSDGSLPIYVSGLLVPGFVGWSWSDIRRLLVPLVVSEKNEGFVRVAFSQWPSL